MCGEERRSSVWTVWLAWRRVTVDQKAGKNDGTAGCETPGRRYRGTAARAQTVDVRFRAPVLVQCEYEVLEPRFRQVVVGGVGYRPAKPVDADQEAVMRVQRVSAPDGGPESWTVVDETFAVVCPVDEFLAHLTIIERSPGTVRSYAFDLRDCFEFVLTHEIDWRTVRLEHLGRFVGWLRLAPATRTAEVTALVIDKPHCSAATINRKLSAVGSFHTYHHRHGVDCCETNSRSHTVNAELTKSPRQRHRL